MKIKVCGMRDSLNVLEVSKLGIDYMGFIFYPKSPRFVNDQIMLPDTDPRIKRIGVFVNAATDWILAAIDRYRLDGVQLHGVESVEQCKELKSHNALIIKVFSIDDSFDFTATKSYRSAVDFFLFDTKGQHPGGNAKTFDWEILSKYDQAIPFFLSGGIGLRSLSQLEKLSGMNIHAIDINSGVESAPGMKDVGAIEQIQNELKKLRL